MTLDEPERVGEHGRKTWLNLDVLCRRLLSTTYPEGLPKVVSEIAASFHNCPLIGVFGRTRWSCFFRPGTVTALPQCSFSRQAQSVSIALLMH